MSRFRPVNRTLGMQPKIGPFNLYQIMVFGVFALPIYYLKEILGLSWLVAGILISTLTGASFLVLGQRPWLFFSRLVRVPKATRWGVLYQSLIEQEVVFNFRSKKRKNNQR